MSFQTSVTVNQGFGVVGELFSDSPKRVKSYRLDSVANTIGYAYSVVSEGLAMVGGTGAFAGILVNPKSYATSGTSADGSLAPTLILPRYTQGELVTMGEVVVYLDTAAAIGDGVFYTDATGALSAGIASTGQTQIVGAKVSRYTLAGAGLATIELLG